MAKSIIIRNHHAPTSHTLTAVLSCLNSSVHVSYCLFSSSLSPKFQSNFSHAQSANKNPHRPQLDLPLTCSFLKSEFVSGRSCPLVPTRSVERVRFGRHSTGSCTVLVSFNAGTPRVHALTAPRKLSVRQNAILSCLTSARSGSGRRGFVCNDVSIVQLWCLERVSDWCVYHVQKSGPRFPPGDVIQV